MSLCIDNVVSNLLLGYLNPKDWSPLIEEIKKYKYVQLQWKILKNPNTTERELKYCNTKAILFIHSDHVIVQDVEMSCNCSRFKVHKVLFTDWGSVFVKWLGIEDEPRLDRCMRDGMYMYGAH